MTRRPLIAGNWKMNGSKLLVEQFVAGLKCIDGVDILICPPFPYLNGFLNADFSFGAQNCSSHDSGAYTGDVSCGMLSEIECDYVIVGHSERREGYNESNHDIAVKTQKVLAQNMTPIVCCGEDLSVRENGSVFDFVGDQLKAVFEVLTAEQLEKIVIAYEPIWAIGTGKTATPEQAQAVHEFIRACLAQYSELAANKVRILYGGSVKSNNASELFSQPDIDGGLVGGASLDLEEFIKICQSAGI